MPARPEPSADPYRTLGLEPGASMAEVKRAYRLLAKAFHPDSAGEQAMPRFLAIQEAYEQLKSGRPARTAVSRQSASAPPAEPWRADPARARAARERARTGAAGRTKASSGPRATGTAGATGASGSAGQAASAGRASTGTRGGTGRRGGTRKATMGSTSYDEARDPNDATWSGASWYGPSTGEYWIVNPREYADPRKHGPEYQSRARRMAAADGLGEEPVLEFAEAPRATAGEPTAGERPAGQGSAGTSAGAWRATSGWTGPRATAQAAEAPFRPGEAAGGNVATDPIERATRTWLGSPADDPVRRLGLALVAWPPLGLAAAAVIGEVTGCARFAADCGGSEPMLPWLAQALILGLLLLLPPVARLLAGGSIAVLVALVPVTAFLVAIGGSGAEAAQAGLALAVFLGVAWLMGVLWAARTFWLRGRLGAGSFT